MIDSHAHMYLADFHDDLQLVLDRARQEGVQHVVLPNIDEESVGAMKNLARAMPDFFSMAIGIHPTSVQSVYDAQLNLVEQELLSDNVYCAIGEIGIDLYWDKTLIKQQKEAFFRQCELALHYKLPVIIHARNAFEEIFQVLQAFRGKELKGVLHCFTGTLQEARQALDLGLYIGLGGVATYKNTQLDEVIRYVGLSSILIETDAPFLAPVPKRGKRNEPAFLVYIARKIAEVLEIPAETVHEATSRQAQRLFQLKGIKR